MTVRTRLKRHFCQSILRRSEQLEVTLGRAPLGVCFLAGDEGAKRQLHTARVGVHAPPSGATTAYPLQIGHLSGADLHTLDAVKLHPCKLLIPRSPRSGSGSSALAPVPHHRSVSPGRRGDGQAPIQLFRDAEGVESISQAIPLKRWNARLRMRP